MAQQSTVVLRTSLVTFVLRSAGGLVLADDARQCGAPGTVRLSSYQRRNEAETAERQGYKAI